MNATYRNTADVTAPSAFRQLYATTRQRQSVCVLAVLAWVAGCDGSISTQEEELLRRVSEGVEGFGPTELRVVTEVGRSGNVDDLMTAGNFLARMDRGSRWLLAELAITMAVQDGRLTVGENHVLQFLADLLGIRPRPFAKLFEQLAHRPFPEPGDPGSPAWWKARAAGEEPHAPADNWGDHHTAEDGAEHWADEPMSRDVGLRLLGLGRDATLEQVHAAYRRLAKVRHPDRYARLGPAAVATATEGFQRLKLAYEAASATPAPGAAS